jgi:hypothetical protein
MGDRFCICYIYLNSGHSKIKQSASSISTVNFIYLESLFKDLLILLNILIFLFLSFYLERFYQQNNIAIATNLC